MRKTVSLFIALLLIWLPVHAEEPLAIVTAADNSVETLTLDNLKLIYQRKSQIDEEGKRWIPLNLPINDPLRRNFSLALFSTLPEEQDSYWNIQYFNGITPPKVMASEEAVLRFIASTAGSIGYVRKHNVDGRVKILLLIPQPSEK